MKRSTLLFGIIIIPFLGFAQNNITIKDLELKILKSDYDSAIIVANQLLETDSVNGMLYYYLGKSYKAKYKYFESIKYFEKANELDSANTVIENALADSYDVIGKDEEAINIYYDQYLRDTLSLEPIIKLGNIFRKKREYGSAIFYYQKAVALDQTNFYFFKQLAFCYDKINITDGAILMYKAALRLNPYDASMYIQLANILNSERRFAEAIDVCKTGLNYFNDNDQLLKLLSYAFYLNKDFDSSIVGFNNLIQMGDSAYFNLKYLGLSFFEKQEFDSTINNLTLARKQNGNDAETCFYLGSAYGRINENEEGLNYLNRALKIMEPSPIEVSNIYSEMAFVFQNQGEYELSLEHLRLAYQYNATPLLSFKIAQLYDYNLKNKKMAINYYDGYLTMANEPDSLLLNDNAGKKSFFTDSSMVANAKERIRILNEELFFEESKKK